MCGKCERLDDLIKKGDEIAATYPDDEALRAYVAAVRETLEAEQDATAEASWAD